MKTAERLSAINRVSSGVAHEVKNPLNAILMHVELARIKLAKGDHNVNQQMDIIASEILRLDRVVKTFLDFTRPVEMKTADVPVDAFVFEMVELARPQAQAVGVTITADLHAAGVTMMVDPEFSVRPRPISSLTPSRRCRGGELRLNPQLREDAIRFRFRFGIAPSMKIFQLYYDQELSIRNRPVIFRIVQLLNGKINL